jgi:hypothetical protein
VGDPLQVPEQFEIRVDSPNTSRKAILGAVPVGWGSRHWEFTGLTAQQFNLKPRSENGMRWILEVLFTLPTREKLLDDETGIPKDYWEAIGGTTTQPAFADDEGTLIVNSAGDPMEGLEREREEAAWSLTKFYGDIAENWAIDRASFAGHCNQFEWAGGAPMTWKCYFKGATPKVIQYVNRGKASSGEPTGGPGADATIETLTIVETKWEFRYEPLTWKCMPWDVGFQEIVGSGGERKVILCDDQKPVRQPVALNADGTRKTPGAPPAVIRGGNGAKLYGVAHFGATFGTPRIIPEEGGS